MVKVKDQIHTDTYSLYLGDCIQVLPVLPGESVGFSIFSPPFADLYSYSDANEDMGNCRDYREFFRHFGFLVEELLRVMLPGRIVAVHCMPLPTFKSGGEEIGTRDFPGDIIRCFCKHGFIYHCPPICIWKDPLIAATRTKAIGLAHKQLVKDSALCRTGFADQIIAFRKPGENPKPILHPEGLTEYHGSRSVPRELDRYVGYQEQGTNKRSHWIWQQYASPVWFDIRQTRVLPFRGGRDPDDQRHVCPLQRDVVTRCLVLWSAPGDVVLDPFMGVGTDVYEAVVMGRKGVGIELKKSYFRQAIRNLNSLANKVSLNGEAD